MEQYIHRRSVRVVFVVDKVALGKFFPPEYLIFTCLSHSIHVPYSFTYSRRHTMAARQLSYMCLTHLSRPIMWATATRPFRFLNLGCRHLVRPPWETNWPFTKPLPTGQIQAPKLQAAVS
jgi:hypothetical protein